MHKKTLGFFQILMINVIAVGSLRTLPFSSVYGVSLIFFYAFAAIAFFLPAALVAAELGTAWPNTGGIYVWVREAFGKKCSFLVIWLSWIYNIIWYPTILALIAGTIAYFFDPDLAANRLYMSCSVVILFWISTWLNLHGMRISSVFSSLGAILGTLLPIFCIIFFGILWIVANKPISPNFFANGIIPSLHWEDNLAFLTAVLFGLLGLEMSATHAAEMKDPKKDYPKAVFVSALVVLVFLVLGSLSIAVVVPLSQLNLAVGAMQAFSMFLHAFHMQALLPVIAFCIVLGGLSAIGAWVIGPTKGICVALEDANIFPALAKKNSQGVPSSLLLTQAGIVSLLSLAFVIFPSVNGSFWFLSVITAQLALVVYIFLFLAALCLRYHKPDVTRSFKVPGGKVGMWTVCLLGTISCLIVIAMGFLPPSQMGVEHSFRYEIALVLSFFVFGLLPIAFLRKVPWRQK